MKRVGQRLKWREVSRSLLRQQEAKPRNQHKTQGRGGAAVAKHFGSGSGAAGACNAISARTSASRRHTAKPYQRFLRESGTSDTV